MYCRFCGEQVPDDTRFCPNCYNPCGFENPPVTQNVSNNQRIRGNNHKSQMNNSDSYSPYTPVNNTPIYQPNMYVNPNNSKYCKGCHNMIDKRSKRCHICGKKQGSNIGAILCIPFLFMFMLIFVIGISSSPSNNASNKTHVYNYSESEVITLGGISLESDTLYAYLNGDSSEYRISLSKVTPSNTTEMWGDADCFYMLPSGKYKIISIENCASIYSLCSDKMYSTFSACLPNSTILQTWAFYSSISSGDSVKKDLYNSNSELSQRFTQEELNKLKNSDISDFWVSYQLDTSGKRLGTTVGSLNDLIEIHDGDIFYISEGVLRLVKIS